MAEKTKFKLDDMVENLTKNYINLGQLNDRYMNSVDVDAVERAKQSTQYGIPAELTPEQLNYMQGKRATDETLAHLNEQIKPIYKDAIGSYLDKLGEPYKLAHYCNLLEKGIVGEKPSEDLQKVAGTVQFADKLRKMIAKGKTAELTETLRTVYQTDIESLLMVNTYAGRGSSDGILRIASEIADKQYSLAQAELKKGKLYGEIEKAVETTDNYGYAFADAYKMGLKEAQDKAKAVEAKKAEAKAKEAAKKKTA